MENRELTKELMAKLEAAASLEEMAAVFAAEGMEITAEQLAELAESMDKVELQEEDLDNVAGGRIVHVTVGPSYYLTYKAAVRLAKLIKRFLGK